MDIGQVVALVEQTVEGVITKVPALVTKVYEGAKGEVLVDLHKLESNITGVLSADDNAADTHPVGGVTVTADLTPPEPSQVVNTTGPDAALTGTEDAFSSMSAQDKADFYTWQAQQQKDGSPS